MSALADPPATGLTMQPSAVQSPSALTADQAGPARSVTIEVPGMPRWKRPWFVQYVEAELNALCALPERWDGHHAQPITGSAIEGTIQVLGALMDQTSPPPQLFPLPDGGIQAEWHIAGNKIEIEIEGNGDAYLLADRGDGSVVAEGAVTRDDPDGAVAAARDFLRGLASRLARVPAGA
jgi:hypothetical protein